MEFDFSRPSPYLFAATVASSTFGGTYFSRLSLSRHLPRLRSRPALSVFLHARLFRLGFGTRDGRGSGMRYFRALGYVPPPHGRGWKRLGRPAPSRPRDFGLWTAGPLGPPLLARRPKQWSLQQVSARVAALPFGATRGRAPGAGLELLSSLGFSVGWRGLPFKGVGLAGFGIFKRCIV